MLVDEAIKFNRFCEVGGLALSLLATWWIGESESVLSFLRSRLDIMTLKHVTEFNQCGWVIEKQSQGQE